MYGHDPTGGSGCGCGGGGGSQVGTRQRYGHIDSQGRCVCGECEPCAGLTCLCRPRFYDGQLLTAGDFTRLDSYIVAKDRLHNRYLHGVGVVCGLEAVCSPCDDTVTVRPGYALGPCGEDIVVCADASVDVAGLIRAQHAAGTRADCAPYSEPVRQDEAVSQKWVLGVCYDERPSRPVTTLKRAGGGCSCGGSGGGSGGCGGSCGGKCGSAPSSTPTCEPTQVCEGYRFTLTRLEKNADRQLNDIGEAKAYAGAAQDQGQLPAVVTACLARLRRGLTRLPSQPSTGQVVAYARELKADLREVIETGNIHDCTLAVRLGHVVVPAADDPEAQGKAQAAIAEMLQVVIDLFRECVCSALLPPCGVSCADDCVPLAVLTVRSSDHQVLDICNWSARQFVITMPTLSYWFGWLPIFGVIRASLERLCCTRRTRRGFEVDSKLRISAAGLAPPADAEADAHPDSAAAAGAAPHHTKGPEDTGTGFASLAGQYAEAWSSLSGLEATVLGAIGAQGADQKPLASAAELEHPLAALALGRLGADAGAALFSPEVRASLGGVLAGRLGGAGVGGNRPRPDKAGGKAGGSEERLADLETRLGKLQRKVDTQARTIRELRTDRPDR